MRGEPLSIYATVDDARNSTALGAGRQISSLDSSAALSAIVLLIAAFVLRGGLFGNAITGLDEQFYLLVGGRMWSGDLPYVDIWDRKPLGLFVLFAGIAVLPGDGVLAAQIVATLFAAATAFGVTKLARRSCSWVPSTMAGIFYIAALNELWDGTTQASVFYNLFVGAAALLTLRARTSPLERFHAAVAATLLLGLAIQIKTNAAFQAAFFGSVLACALWRADQRSAPVRILLLVLVGSGPTLGAIGLYLYLGEFSSWWQANVLSVLAKGRPTDQFATLTFVETEVLFAPVLILMLVGLHRRTVRFTKFDSDVRFFCGWMMLAFVDFIAIGGYFPHYAAPLLLACCPLIASAFAIKRWGAWIFTLALAWPLAHAVYVNRWMTEREQEITAKVLGALPEDVSTRCLFMYEGPPIYYHLSKACFVTRFVFTAHLGSQREAPSLGVDPADELRAALERRPGTVITVARSRWSDRNPSQERVLMQELRSNYHVAKILPYRPAKDHGELVLWRLNGL